MQYQTIYTEITLSLSFHLYPCTCNICTKWTTKGIAVIGPQAIDPSLLPGNYADYPDKGCRTILEGLKAGLGENINATCTQLQNIDYYQPGNPSTQVASADECCELCFLDTTCNYWTFYANACYFKETDAGNKTSDGRISGYCTNKNINSKVQNANGCVDVACDDQSEFPQALSLIANMSAQGKLSAIVVMLGMYKIQNIVHVHNLCDD